MRNEDVMKRTGQGRLQDVVAARRLRFWGHVSRMQDDRIPKTALTWVPDKGKRKKGRPRHNWRRTIDDDLKNAGLSKQKATEIANNRKEWGKLIARCVQGHGRI